MTVLILLCVIGSGLMAGLFYAFSAFIMRAFAQLGPAGGIAAMNAINTTIVRSSFLVIFFGTALAGLAAVAAVLMQSGATGSWLIVLGCLVYVAGAIVVTILANVPLNNRLAAVPAESDEGRSTWERYLVDWVRWNHVRTAACTVACALFALALAGCSP